MKRLSTLTILVLILFVAAGCGGGSGGAAVTDLTGTWTGSGQATLSGGGLDGTYPLNGSMKFTKINDTTYQVTYTINVPSEGLSETLTDTMTYVGGVIFDSDGVSVGTASGNTISVNYSTTVEGVSGTLTASLQKV